MKLLYVTVNFFLFICVFLVVCLSVGICLSALPSSKEYTAGGTSAAPAHGGKPVECSDRRSDGTFSYKRQESCVCYNRD